MTIAERKEREREERRMQIISAAEHLFFENGYDPVSMEQIAREAELSKGTIFFYFKNKEALFFTIVLQGVRLFHQKVAEDLSLTTGSAIERLYILSMAAIRFSHEYPGYRSLIRLMKSGRFTIDDRAREDPEISEILGHTEALTGFLEEIVMNGIEDGSIRNDIDPVELAIMVKMLLSPVMDMNPEMQWSLRSHDLDEGLLNTHYLDLVISVIRRSELQ